MWFFIFITLFLTSNALADSSSEEGKRTAESFGSFLKSNISSFSGALTGKTKLKTQSGEEFDATVESGGKQVDYIKLWYPTESCGLAFRGKLIQGFQEYVRTVT